MAWLAGHNKKTSNLLEYKPSAEYQELINLMDACSSCFFDDVVEKQGLVLMKSINQRSNRESVFALQSRINLVIAFVIHDCT